jgi:hypothetical protein
MDVYNLYPRLIPSVGLEFIGPADKDVLTSLAEKSPDVVALRKLRQDLGELEYILVPRVYGLPTGGYIIDETAADYAPDIQDQLVARWRLAGASNSLLGIIRGAQNSMAPRIIIEPGGMYPERSARLVVDSVGKKSLSKKDVRKLLRSLKMAHEHYWPVDMLANILNPYIKKTH